MRGDQLQNIIATNIRHLRHQLRLTQASLAERAGISTGYMCDIERSRRWPSAENLARLAEALKVDPFQFFLASQDSPYFDRHRTLTAYDNMLQELYDRSREEALDRMLSTYGPMRQDDEPSSSQKNNKQNGKSKSPDS